MLRIRSRRHSVYHVCLGVALALAAATPLLAAPPKPVTPTRTVCVDAGHGGSDPGASYAGLQEKNLTLDIANRLKGLLEPQGYKVVMTRTGDQSLGNTDRANICNAGNADTVLSIHLNASSDASVDYFKAFYGKQIKDGEFTQTIWNTYTLDIPKSPTAQFASGLLLKTNAPATLAETVFLSNPREQQLLSDGSGQRQQAIAQQLFNGLQAWYSRP